MSGDESSSGQQPQRRLKLVLKTSPLSTPTTESDVNGGVILKDGSSSPPRPSYSPVTPTLSHEKLAVQEKPERQIIDEPAPVPFNLDDNADAIALKATISLLQMQRQQSLKDIRDLDRMKDAALENPRGFADELRAGKLSKPKAGEIVFDDIEYKEDEADEDDQTQSSESKSQFGQLPNAQNIARCPPIEWSKYHIIGTPLDELHDLQKQFPGATPAELASRTARKHEVTAPYRPFTDKLKKKSDGKGHG